MEPTVPAVRFILNVPLKDSFKSFQCILVEYRTENQIAVGGKSKYDVRNIRQEICSHIKKKITHIHDKTYSLERKTRVT